MVRRRIRVAEIGEARPGVNTAAERRGRPEPDDLIDLRLPHCDRDGESFRRGASNSHLGRRGRIDEAAQFLLDYALETAASRQLKAGARCSAPPCRRRRLRGRTA